MFIQINIFVLPAVFVSSVASAIVSFAWFFFSKLKAVCGNVLY